MPCAAQDFECMRTTPVETQGFTYNSVGQGNPGGLFCKMQVPGPSDSLSDRSGTGAYAGVPNVLKLNRVAAGVGLSNYQFKESSFTLPDGTNIQAKAGQLACGMCLKATFTQAAGFNNANCELTALEKNYTKELTFMVFDQCKDAGTCCRDNRFCSDDRMYGSWLDIDIYGDADVEELSDYTWEAVECPVGDDIKITLAYNQYASRTKQAVWPWDTRVPVQSVEYKCNQEAASYKSMEWADSLGYVMWFSDCHEGDLLVYRITSIYGEQLEYALTEALPEITDGDQSYQYLRETSVQFASKNDPGPAALYPQQPAGGKECNSFV